MNIATNNGLRLKSIFKNALLNFKTSPRESLSISLYLIFGLWLSMVVPYVGTILCSLIFVNAYHFVQLGSGQSDRGLKGLAVFIFNARSWKTSPLVIFVIPSLILIGTAQGLAFTPSNSPSLIFLGSFTLGWLTLVYLTITLQGVFYYLNKSVHILEAADMALKLGFKNFKFNALFSFYAAVLFVIAILPMGLGIVFALPIYLFCLKELQK